ncbi:MAG: AbrB family transcriptional regulator [Clostridia bacterium]|nr:AbrB family transcriptional regulator [Clostridia bacterium]
MLKNVGIVRKVDELGRIVVPIELRRSLGIGDRAEVEIYLDEKSNQIILRKHQPMCAFCQSEENIISYKNQLICKNCVNEIGDTEE